MTNKRYIHAIALMGLTGLLLAGCTDDSSDLTDEKLVPLNLCSLGNTRLQEGEGLSTRADDGFVPGTGGSDNTEGVPQFIPYNKLYPLPINVEYTTIGAFLVEDAKDNYSSLAGYFSYKEDNSWSTTVGIKPGDFYIFGYMPSNMSGMSASIKKRDGHTTWASGCELTLQNLSTVTPADVCVVVGVLKGTAEKLPIDNATVVSDIHQGVYSYEGAEKDNYVYLLLDHLYTNVNLELSVEPEYAQLRTIVLKEVYMQSTVKSTVDLNITLTDDRKQPIQKITYGESQNQATVNALIMNETQARAISADATNPTSVPGYFAPGMTTQAFNFEFVYDVYDKKNIDETHPYGNLVRQNCHAINKWSLSGSTVTAGKSFKVKATIKPTYLYQLSEPDLDNPTIVLDTTNP